MKKYCFAVVLLFLFATVYSQTKTIDLTQKVGGLKLIEGKNVIEKSNNGYQLILEKAGNINTWKMISPTGSETILNPQSPDINRAKKKGTKKPGPDRPTSCSICYTYPVPGGEMEICYSIPCP